PGVALGDVGSGRPQIAAPAHARAVGPHRRSPSRRRAERRRPRSRPRAAARAHDVGGAARLSRLPGRRSRRGGRPCHMGNPPARHAGDEQQEKEMTEVWVAPGPGSWMRDDVHFTGAMSGYLAAVFPSAFAEGWRQGMARYGLPLEAIEPAIVGGRMFARPKPLGAPDPKPGKTPSPPPKAVVRMLFAVHPELRRRKKAAKETFATHRWRADRAAWRTQHAPVLRTRCLELQSIDPATLDDGEFRAHLARLEALFHDGKVLHFGQNPASAVPVGDLVAHVEEWTGAPPARVAAALQGHNPSSAQTLPFLDAIAAAIRDVPGLAADFDAHDGTAIDRLHLLRNASPEVTAALDAYRTEFGRRVVTGFDVTDETLDELPGLVVSSIGV